jgi:hypothetical protein
MARHTVPWWFEYVIRSGTFNVDSDTMRQCRAERSSGPSAS